MGMLEVDVLRQKITDVETGREWKGMGKAADNADAVKAAHRAAMETMTKAELVQLLIADDPARFPEDDWFRDLIVDVLKHRKENEP